MTKSRTRFIVAAFASSFLMLAGVISASADQIVTIDQNWSEQEKNTWYALTQGSRLIPLSWLLALEQPNSQQAFLDDAFVEKFRYLPGPAYANPRLPVGFVTDSSDDRNLSNTKLRWKEGQSPREKWVGMNCAACHTAEVTYQGKRVRIEGGPTLADFQGFIEALNSSLIATRDNSDKASRFATAVLGKEDEKNTKNTPQGRQLLHAALSKLIGWQSKIETANATSLRYGFGRLDAFGHIFNKVAIIVDAPGQNYHPSNAPVSYPFLWNAPQHDKVQWNGIVHNQRVGNGYDIGALGRNVGEVTGVFADVKIVPGLPRPVVTSSANVKNLGILENQLKSLLPPLWPTGVLGTLDQNKRDRGRRIFNETKRSDGTLVRSCAGCHPPLARKNLTALIDAQMIPLRDIGTDIWMACNSVTHEVKTGVFNNTLDSYLWFTGGEVYGDRAKVAELLRTAVVGTIWKNRSDVIEDVLDTTQSPDPDRLGTASTEAHSSLPPNERPLRAAADQSRRNQCLNGTDELLAYKGRPLTGIWATAPYLHNGSVPTLYDLLLPPDQRPKSFAVGTREFDPKYVGFVTRDASGAMAQPSGDNSFLFNTRNAAGRVIDGNSNAGHDYGNASFTEDDRMALIEYLKGI